MLKLEKLKKYFKKRWLNQISPEELSVYEINMTTDNGAESYHSKLKSRIRCSHPRIWTFMTNHNEIIKDTNNDISRLYQGREISRSRSKSNLKVGEQRTVVKQKLSEGELTPWKFLQAMSHTIGCIKAHDDYLSSESELSEDEADQNTDIENACTVCLSRRADTWLFMPCRHASFCGFCSERIMEIGQLCPICRSNIELNLKYL